MIEAVDSYIDNSAERKANSWCDTDILAFGIPAFALAWLSFQEEGEEKEEEEGEEKEGRSNEEYM